jgi:molybdopterin molybdotransferase
MLAELGVEPVFHKIALRPGKPLWFGVKEFADRRVLVFGLPGNPVSGLVCFELFVRPAIAALAGRGFTSANSISARLKDAYFHKGGRAACLPARITWEGATSRRPKDESPPVGPDRNTPTVEILPWHGSADMATLAQANGLVRLPVEPLTLETGSTLEVLLV